MVARCLMHVNTPHGVCVCVCVGGWVGGWMCACVHDLHGVCVCV